MRKCYVCQQMKAVVTVTKKPDGKRGYLCSDCPVDTRNDWYFWTQNQHCHFIQFRTFDYTVASARVFPLGERFTWKVTGPCWSPYEAEGVVDTLDMAKAEVESRVMKIIHEEYQPEYIPLLG